MAVIKNKRILKCLLMMVVSLFLILNFSIGVSASSGYDRQEVDTCITISQRLSVKGGSTSIWNPSKNKNSLWNKGKLKVHFEKHGLEVGAKSSAEYSKMALDFGTKQSPNIIQAENGSFLYRFDPTTNEVFVGTSSGGKIKTYYKWDGRTDDAVINYLKEIGLWN